MTKQMNMKLPYSLYEDACAPNYMKKIISYDSQHLPPA